MQKIFNKIIIIIFFFITACAASWDDIKKGLGGEKTTSTDEFLVKKKDPLTMPPRWGELPEPGHGASINDGIEEVMDIEELIHMDKVEKNSVDIEQDGTIFIGAVDQAMINRAKEIIEDIRKQGECGIQ